jgi:uncharacterized protein YndB with AHSA1/START domain
MKILKILVGILVALVVVVYGIGMALSSDYRVTRSIEINASAADVFPWLEDFRQWKEWGVWYERDPDMTVTYQGNPGEIGYKSAWQSATEGNGEMELVEKKKNEYLKYALRFPDYGMSSTGEITLTENNGVTTVTWTDYGDVGSDITARYFLIFMDEFIGPDFEAGLKNLKRLVEAQAQKG